MGDTISFSGSALDGHDNPLPPSALSWTILLHHCVGSDSDCHIHILQSFDGEASDSFGAPDHEYPSFLEIQLTATDPANGLQTTTSVTLHPQTVTLNFDSSPAGAQVMIDGWTLTTPDTFQVIKGSTNTIGTAEQQTINSGGYVFTSWSDAGAASHDVVVNADTSYSATFTRVPVKASKVTLSNESPNAPGLWTAGQQPPPAGQPDAVIAWRGTDASHRINIMYDAYGTRKKVTLSETSASNPSLVFFNGQVWLAWTGTGSTHTLNVMSMGTQGLVCGTKVTLSQYGRRACPRRRSRRQPVALDLDSPGKPRPYRHRQVLQRHNLDIASRPALDPVQFRSARCARTFACASERPHLLLVVVWDE